jgi:putative flippase GtrA
MWAQGVDLDRFHPPPTPSRRPLTALYVGRLAAEKRVEALAHLGALIGLKVIVVGDGPARLEIEAALAHLDVEFRGVLEGDALAHAYREADVFVFPSETDTLGLVLLEAMASGLPVVAAESPASREVLGSCPATRRWDPARPDQLPEVVTELLGSASRPTLQAQARAQVAGVSWSRATTGLVATYKAARARSRLSGRGRRPRRLGRFAAVGAGNVAIDVGVFNVLAAIGSTHSPTQLAAYNTVAVALALANSYAWNSRWTFTPHEGCEWRWRTWHRRALFVAQGLLNLAVNDAAVLIAAVLLERAGRLPAVAVANGSKVVGMVAASLVSYAFMRGIVFRNRKRQPGEPAPSAEGAHRPRVVSG